MSGHTPGPWRWEVNRAHKSVKLCGGPPKRGFGRYDLTVLGFQRYGMNQAAPVFWNWDFDKSVGEPKRADELAAAVDGREHHAAWFADIDHPDARLIAAAPDLVEALVRVVQYEGHHVYCGHGKDYSKPCVCGLNAAHAAANAAIAKARGAA